MQVVGGGAPVRRSTLYRPPKYEYKLEIGLSPYFILLVYHLRGSHTVALAYK